MLLRPSLSGGGRERTIRSRFFVHHPQTEGRLGPRFLRMTSLMVGSAREENPGYLGFGESAINHRRLDRFLADWRHGKAGCRCDPVRLLVLFAYSVVDGFGGAEAVDGPRGGEREQRNCLRHRYTDGTAWVYSGEPVLYWGVCGQYP